MIFCLLVFFILQLKKFVRTNNVNSPLRPVVGLRDTLFADLDFEWLDSTAQMTPETAPTTVPRWCFGKRILLWNRTPSLSSHLRYLRRHLYRNNRPSFLIRFPWSFWNRHESEIKLMVSVSTNCSTRNVLFTVTRKWNVKTQ